MFTKIIGRFHLNIGFFFLLFIILLSLFPQAIYSVDGKTKTEEVEESVVIYGTNYPKTDGFSIWNADRHDVWNIPAYGGLYYLEGKDSLKWAPLIADGFPVVEIHEEDKTMDVYVTIKEDAKFYNGENITADDVVFTYQMALTPAVNEYTGFFYYDVFTYVFSSNESISKVDDKTVKFQFNQITAFYLLWIGWIVLPKSVFEPNYLAGIYDNYTNSSGIYLNAAGPYILTEFDLENSTALFTKNPYWLGNPIQTDNILYKYYNCTESSSQILSDFENGKIDILGPETFWDQLLLREDISTLDGVTHAYAQNGMNHQLAVNHANGYINGSLTPNGIAAGTDPELYKEFGKYVRKAISHTVDRETIVRDIMNYLAQEAASIVSSSYVGYDISLVVRDFNLETAKDYMELAGFDYSILGGRDFNPSTITKDNCFFDVWCITTDFPPKLDTMQLIADDLASIGIYANVTIVDFGDFWELSFFRAGPTLPGSVNNETYIGGFDLYEIGVSFSPLPEFEPTSWFEEWATPPYGNNIYNYNESGYEEVYLKYTTEMDFIKRIDAFKDWQAYMYEWEPTIPLMNRAEYFAYLDTVTGVNENLFAEMKYNWQDISGERTMIVTITKTTNSFILISVITLMVIPLLYQKRKKRT